MNNNLNFQFGMYEPATDSIIVNTGKNSILVIRCKECNSKVIFDYPNDIVGSFIKLPIAGESSSVLALSSSASEFSEVIASQVHVSSLSKGLPIPNMNNRIQIGSVFIHLKFRLW